MLDVVGDPASVQRVIELQEAIEARKKELAQGRWKCDRELCDGEPHEGVTWCDHETHVPACRHARSEQLPPTGDWSVWLFMAGRGAGKTRAAAEAVLDAVLEGRATRIAFVARTPADVRETMIHGESGLVACAQRRGFSVGKDKDVWPITSMSRVLLNLAGHKAVITTYASTVADALRGPNFDLAWADEPAAWIDAHKGTLANTTWTNLRLALRVGSERTHLIATTTPKPVSLIRQVIALPDVRIVSVPTSRNERNLAPDFLATLHGAYQGTRLERQELAGELLLDVEGALWSYDQLSATRVDAAPDLTKVVIGVDPSGSKGGDSTGIVVMGKSGTHGYILADKSGQWSPSEMGRIVAYESERWGVNEIIAEGNFGGEMVREILQVAGVNIPIKIVHASRGKRPRAEPAAALSGDPARPETWEGGRLHIVGQMD